MKTRLLFIGDSHVGSKVGLLPGGFKDEYGAQIPMGASQKLIWKKFKEIEHKADKDCDELLLVLMSDLVHGPENDIPGAVWTTDVKAQCDAFIHAVLPIANKAKSSYVVDSLSRFHVDPGRFADDYVASELGAFGKKSHIRLDIHIGDIFFRIQHHGPSLGWRPHTRGDAVRRFLRDSYIESLERKEDPPDVFMWAHWHQYHNEIVRVGLTNEKEMQAFFTPALTFPDKRTVRNVKRLETATIGALALDIEDGQITEHKWFKQYSTRRIIKH